LGDTLVGDFDVDSVMSYCSQMLRLTQTDLFGANLFYGMAPSLQVALF
jgi:hypothetical protein